MHIGWDDVRVFLAVAERGSMSGAARALGVGQPTVSRRLAALEEQLGYVVFRRGVEGVSLTTAGERLVQPARRMAEWAAELERNAERPHDTPTGVVRIAAPPGVAFDFLAPFAAWARDRLPQIRLEVSSSVRFVDLSRREADLALRIYDRSESELVSVAKLEVENAPFAAASYARRLPPGYEPADVDWIGWASPLEQLSPNPELAALIPGFRPVFASDDFLVQWRAAEAGVGALFLGRVRHRFSRSDQLQELNLDFGSPIRRTLHLVGAKSALAVPRVRAVAELLAAEIEQTRALSRSGTPRSQPPH